jgi:biotin carboxyl carrier protein
MKFKIKIKGKEYEVEIVELEGGIKIKIGDKEFFFQKEKKEISLPSVSFKKRDFLKKEIRAPIAGTISEIFVKEKDFVKKGEKVLILSAMKMENEIVSDFEGRVKKIFVKKDQNVKEGEVLILLE